MGILIWIVWGVFAVGGWRFLWFLVGVDVMVMFIGCLDVRVFVKCGSCVYRFVACVLLWVCSWDRLLDARSLCGGVMCVWCLFWLFDGLVWDLL